MIAVPPGSESDGSDVWLLVNSAPPEASWRVPSSDCWRCTSQGRTVCISVDRDQQHMLDPAPAPASSFRSSAPVFVSMSAPVPVSEIVIITAAGVATAMPKSNTRRKSDRHRRCGQRRENPLPGSSSHGSTPRWVRHFLHPPCTPDRRYASVNASPRRSDKRVRTPDASRTRASVTPSRRTEALLALRPTRGRGLDTRASRL